MLKLNTDKFSASLSVLAGASLPQYTVQGYLLRCLAAAGSEAFVLNGLLQLASPEYIKPSGTASTYALICGSGFSGIIEPVSFDISYKADYCLKRKKPEVVPLRFIEQTEQIDAEIEFSGNILSLGLDGGYSAAWDGSGLCSEKAAAEAFISAEKDRVRIKLNCGGVFYEPFRYYMHGSLLCGADLTFNFDAVSFSFGFDYGDEEFRIKADSRIRTDNYCISGGIVLSGGLVDGFSIGFETS